MYKNLTNLCLTSNGSLDNNTYLSVGAAAIYDMNGNALVSVEDFEALPVDSFTEDEVPPELQFFNLDLNTGVLTLLFSETVRLSTFDVTQVTLQNTSSDPLSFHSLSNNSFTDSNDSSIVIVQIAPQDLNEIKRLDTLAIDNSTVFVSISSQLVEDMNSNENVAILSSSALPVSVYVFDMNQPSLEEFDLNLNSSELLLRFNETVNRESLNVESITIQHARVSSGPLFTLQLTEDSTSLSPDNTYIIIDIGSFDLNNLKRLTEVATSMNNTYLSLNSSAIKDMNENAIIQIPGTNGLQVTDFIQDEIQPILEGFSLDVNRGILVLTFSETVNAETLNISTITLQSESTLSPGENYTLSEGRPPGLSYSNSTDDPVLVVFIGRDDLNAIKAIFELANSPNSTYVSVNEDTVQDMVGEVLRPILPASALPVDSYTADTTGPLLESFTLNLTTETLTLTFDETVNIDSFNVTQLILQSDSNISLSSTQILRDYRSLSIENSTTVSVLLTLDDLHEIKLNTELATTQDNIFIQTLPNTVHDMALESNYIQPSVVAAGEFYEDFTSPMLVTFAVDMNLGLLILNFDEPVNVSSVDFTAITLLSGPESVDMDGSGNDTLFNGTAMDNEFGMNQTNETNGSGSGELIIVPAPSFYTLTGGFTNSSNGLQITIVFTDDDLNAIKEIDTLFTSNTTSHMSVLPSAITDMNNNPLSEVPTSDPLQTSLYINDTTQPMLLGFDLDMNTGLLLLSFPETVDVSTTMFDGIVLQRSPNVSLDINQYMLMGGSLTMMDDGLTVSIQITNEDLNEIKRRRIALTPDTTWLTIDEAAILDMSDQGVIASVNGLNAIQVTNYTTDSTQPELEAFVFDFEQETLTLSFTETVNDFQFNVTSITLQDTVEGNNTFSHYTLTDSSYLNSSSSDVLTVVLGLDDLNAIKQLAELATSENNTFIRLDLSLVADVFGNSVVQIAQTEAQSVREYVFDSTSPTLNAFDIDLDSRVITLYFSETVNASSLNVTGITLTSGPLTGTLMQPQLYQLQTSFTNSTNGPEIEILLTRDDFDSIKVLTQLATSENDTFLAIDTFTIVDMAENLVANISVESPQQVQNYTKDVSSPVLESFDLNMNDLILTLRFSEAVNVSSIDYTAISIVDSGVLSYTLLSGATESVNGATIIVQILKLDEDNLKRIENLSTNENNTFLILTSDLILDLDDNPVLNITSQDRLPVFNFTEDSTPPYMVYFNLDLTENMLTLVFTETVNISSLDVTGITLQSEEDLNDNTTQFHTLRDSVFDTSVNNPFIVINLSRSDGNEIRRLTQLGIDSNSTFLTLPAGTVYDMVSLPNVPIFNSFAEMVLNYTVDSISPELESFSLNLSSEILTLFFSETINISTFDAAQITIYSSVSNQSTGYTLTGGIVQNADHTPTVLLGVTTADLNVIKMLTQLATSPNNTFLSLTEATVDDMNSNPVIPISIPEPNSGFVPDSVPPTLVLFDLDLDSEILTLIFSETVNADSLDVTQISLQSETNASDTEVPFTLTTASFTESNNNTVIEINIGLSDLNRLKQLAFLAVDNETTFISMTTSAISDMNANMVEAIPPSNALPVSQFTVDSTQPSLEFFSLNLDEEILLLSFSETVNVSSFDVTGITLQSTEDSDVTSITLTSYANISMINSPTILVQLAQADLNLLKSITTLGTTDNDTFISLTSNVVRDMFDNPLNETLPSSALQVGNFTSDFTPPRLVSFDLDINAGTITFYFSESVNATSLDPTQVTLLSSFNLSMSNYTLMEFSQVPLEALESDTIIEMQLSITDLNNIKSLVNLTTSDGDTFISISSDFIQDQFDNNIISIATNDALAVMNYTVDSTCPYLDDFSIDLNQGVLLLTFIEPVNTSTFDPTTITISSAPVAMPESNYTLTSGDFNRNEFTRFLNLMLSDFDFNLIKADTDLATNVSDTFVLLSEYSVTDTAGNLYCNDTQPSQSTDVMFDTTLPVLLNFTINLDQEVLILTFSETVTLPLEPTAITLLAEPDLSQRPEMMESGFGSVGSSFNVTPGSGGNFSGSTSSGSGTMMDDIIAPSVSQYTLTSGLSMIDFTTQPHVVVFTFTQDDLNAIKHIPGLANSPSTSSISISSTLTTDYSENTVVSIPPYDPLEAADFIADMTPPRLESFDLNMDTLTLTLSFSEVVNITTFNVDELTLQNSQSIDIFYTLQDGTVMLDETLLTRVAVRLSESDANNIKAMTSLASSMSDTHLSFTSELVRDTFGLQVQSIANTSAVPVLMYDEDMSPPVLRAFIFNLTSETILLTFDETVNASSVRPQSITVQSDEDGTNAYRLRGGIVSTTDSTIVSINLTDIDLHSIKRNLDLATDLNNTCISLTPTAVADLSSPSVQIEPTVQCASDFEEDTISPQLRTFAVNLNTGLLTLNFDEPVDIATINLTLLTLQESAVSGGQEVTLTGGEVSTVDQLQVLVNFTLDDLNAIKQQLNLLRDRDSTFLRIQENFIQDLNRNNVVEIQGSDPLPVSVFIDDETSPVLQLFDLDVNTGYLTLFFSETVDVSSIDFTGITLQMLSDVSQPDDSYTLTSGAVLNVIDSPVVVIEITNTDLNVLKTRDIGRSNDSVFLTLRNGSISDINGEAVIAVENGINALPVQDYTPDFTPPMLVSFSIDLTAETLSLSFNESVDFQSLNVTFITLTSSVNETSNDLSYTLTGTSSTDSDNEPLIVIHLSDEDLNEMKRRQELATSENNTFIFLSSSAIADTFGNPVVELTPGDLIQASTHTDDQIEPTLNGFDLDMNTGTLTLTFSETVNTSSLNTNGITLVSNETMMSSEMYQLSGLYTSVTPPSNIILVVLTNHDLNELKYRQMLAIDNTSTFLYITPNTIRDMNSNFVLESEVLSVGNFTPDTTPPLFLNFTIDMNRGELTLSFDETINSSSLQFEYLALINNVTFVPTPPDPDDQHQLTGGTVLTDNSPTLTFGLSEADLNEIKRKDMCTRALGVLDCFLVYRTDAVEDMNTNSIEGCRQVN